MTTVQNSCKQIFLWTVKWEKDNRGWTFSQEHLTWYFVQKWLLKRINDGFVSCKHADFHFIRHELIYWSHVDYWWINVMFLSAFLTAPIHCRGSFGEQVMKQTHLHLAWPEKEYIFGNCWQFWMFFVIKLAKFYVISFKEMPHLWFFIHRGSHFPFCLSVSLYCISLILWFDA